MITLNLPSITVEKVEHVDKFVHPKGVLGLVEKPTYLNYGVVIPHDDEN